MSSSLQRKHQDSGAFLIDIHEARIPSHFGDSEAEYRALSHHAALLDLSMRALWKVSGADRVLFLQNMLTNNINCLKPGQGCRAFKLNLKGKIEAAITVLVDEDVLWCDLEPGPAPQTLVELNKRIILEKVQIEDLSAQWCVLSVQGPQAARVLSTLDVEPDTLLNELQSCTIKTSIQTLHVVRNDHTGVGGFDLYVPSECAAEVWQLILDRGRASVPELMPAGFEALNVKRVESGIPWHGSEVTQDYFPQEVGLEEGWISYTKGCYLGQETMSRIHHQGHVNRHLRQVVFKNTDAPVPSAGEPLWHDGSKVGVITSAVLSPQAKRPIALAYVKKGFASTDTVLECNLTGVSLVVTVHPRRYVRNKYRLAP